MLKDKKFLIAKITGRINKIMWLSYVSDKVIACVKQYVVFFFFVCDFEETLVSPKLFGFISHILKINTISVIF